MGRPKLYHTVEEQKLAAKKRNQKYLSKPGMAEIQRERNRKGERSRWLRWYHKNKTKHNARSKVRAAMLLQRLPAWADIKAIELFYENRPEGHHVDHIIPLRGKTVSGLHVLENLQYLPAYDNMSKNNNFVP